MDVGGVHNEAGEADEADEEGVVRGNRLDSNDQRDESDVEEEICEEAQ